MQFQTTALLAFFAALQLALLGHAVPLPGPEGGLIAREGEYPLVLWWCSESLGLSHIYRRVLAPHRRALALGHRCSR
ncbi:hypothetical protein BV25DRAFT_1831938 [Artomyces pyxidatus]|uniref:Uncharacterized protein n=1 Tax=Artomyces pyxidatus TaxID=48021 RepID=A0ACB8SLB1_9AGAM|nr:hypothetical protein BV25DRAFT_1831938 [Artomyces pyxidatus]